MIGTEPLTVINPEKGRKRDCLEILQKCFSEFFKLQTAYGEEFEWEEAAFGYTEMTNVAMLSAAAISQGNFSICEYQTLKNSKSSCGKVSQGRADLYISPKGGDKQMIIEAKQIWSYSSNLMSRKIVVEACESADADAKNTSTADSDCEYIGVSCLFILHFYKKTYARPQNRNYDRAVFKDNLEKLAENRRATCFAYYRAKTPVKNWGVGKDLLGFGTILKFV